MPAVSLDAHIGEARLDHANDELVAREVLIRDVSSGANIAPIDVEPSDRLDEILELAGIDLAKRPRLRDRFEILRREDRAALDPHVAHIGAHTLCEWIPLYGRRRRGREHERLLTRSRERGQLGSLVGRPIEYLALSFLGGERERESRQQQECDSQLRDLLAVPARTGARS